MWQTQAILSRAPESGRRSIFSMTDPDGSPATAGLPHQIDHRHADVTGGWLRAATFGAMDGLVSNTALIAGVAASASTNTVVLSASQDCWQARSRWH
jgi:VIT1/CCC1 family predicted Fe2+/Mn2+ transporter